MSSYAQIGQGWGLKPSILSENLTRRSGPGYGGMYGAPDSASPVYANRMAEIQGNFAAKQAQLDEAQRRHEFVQSRRLADQQFGLQQQAAQQQGVMSAINSMFEMGQGDDAASMEQLKRSLLSQLNKLLRG